MGNSETFCQRYHRTMRAKFRASFAVACSTDDSRSIKAYVRIIVLRSAAGWSLFYPPHPKGSSSVGKSQSLKRIKKHPAERADHAYHGGQFHNGEW